MAQDGDGNLWRPAQAAQIARRAACALALVGTQMPARPQAAPPDTAAPLVTQEVVITAERVPTLLGQTPVSVGVVDQTTIDALGIGQLSDLVGVVAGVAVPNGFGNMPQAVGIRGVGVSVPAMSQAVGIYVDDVPLIRGYATALWDLPDIERIEVLRGPQGTLYGQNLTAGAVKLVSMDPSAQPQAWASASVGNLGAREVHAYATGPLAQDGALTGSLALSSRRNDGFGYNATRHEDVNRLDATQFRAKLRLAALPAVDAVLAVDGLLDRSDANTTNFPLNTPDAAPRVTFTAVDAGAFKRQAGGLSLKVHARLGDGLDFHSITAFRAYRDDPTVADWGGLATLRYLLSQQVEQKAFSQEFQLQGQGAGLQWTAGAMLVSDRFDFGRFTTAAPPAAPAPAYSEAETHLATTDLGLYGQMRSALTPQTGVTAGLRAYRTRQTGTNQYWVTDAQQQRTSLVYLAPDLSTMSTGVLPRLGVDHQASPDLFLYASVAEGAKFAGYNRAAQSQRSAEVAADPEKVTTLEFGAKGRFADGRVRANLAIFYNDYRDYLASLANLRIDGVLVTDSVLVNAGKAHTFGADLDLTARLGRTTEANLSLELLRSRFDAFENPTGAPATDYVGNELPFAPHVSLGAGLRHVGSWSDVGTVTLDGALRFVSRQYADAANSSAQRIPSQTYVDVGAGFRPTGQRWSFSLRVKNLFDRTYVLIHTAIPPLGIDSAYYNAPRTLLLTARYDL